MPGNFLGDGMGRFSTAPRVQIVASLLLSFGAMLAAASPAAAIESIKLTQVGHSDLAVRGADGQTKPRGQNGDVATLGDAAFVAGGALFHGAQSTPGRICTDYGGVKVVDVSDPASPIVKSKIDIADPQGVVSGPKGNPRRNAKVPNVSASVSSVDALRFPNGKSVLAIATQRCEPSFFSGGRIEFWDVSNLNSPTQIGTYATPTTAGIIEDVRMFTRADKPNQVFAVTTLPFTGANGEFRLLDVSEPASPAEIGIFPNTGVAGSNGTNNGCRIFAAGRSAAPTPDGKRAIASFYDGIQPPTAPESLGPNFVDFGSPNTAALLNLDLDQLPSFASGTGTNADPKKFSPNPPVWGYGPGLDTGNRLDDTGPASEGNAADVQPFVGSVDQLLAFVSEDDVDPATTQVSIDSPTGLAGSQRGCFGAVGARPYLLPGQQLQGQTAYVGRACPTSGFNRTTLRAADPLLADPTGKIAVVESGGDQFNGCSNAEKVQRLAAAGAIGVMGSLGGDFLNQFIQGPAGGINSIPLVGVQSTTFNKLTNYVPNRILSGVTFPTTFTRSSATNVTVKPFAVALGCPAAASQPGGAPVDACDAATNASPITITATNHGLVTGDRVVLSDVTGNTAANGVSVVTVLNANQFTLNGSAGNGVWAGGGSIQACLPSPAACAATPARTDFSRFRSVADATDPVAGAQVAAASQLAVVPGQSYRAGTFLEVAAYTSGTFRAAVEWFDGGGASVRLDAIPTAGLSAVTPRTRFERTLTAPANAAKAAVKFEWTGGGAGTAFADTFSFAPDDARATVKDNPGAGNTPEWGAQRIIDFSQTVPKEIGTYRSPTSKLFPPPDDGIYAPRQARMFGADVAFTTWLSDGVRALDVSNPASPKEVGAFVPPAVNDPSPAAGAGISNLDTGDPANLRRGQSWPNRPLATGVGVIPRSAKTATVVVSDINGGLYVLNAEVDPAPAPPPGGGGTGTTPERRTTPTGPSPGPAPPAADKTAPGVSAFKLTNRRFRVSSRRTAKSGVAAQAGRSKQGTTLTYTLSEAATVKIAVVQVRAGRRRGTRCVAPTRKLRKATSCTRLTRKGTLTRVSRSGANRVAFSGRFGATALKPGRYRATLVATDTAKNVSRPRTISFTVVKR